MCSPTPLTLQSVLHLHVDTLDFFSRPENYHLGQQIQRLIQLAFPKSGSSTTSYQPCMTPAQAWIGLAADTGQPAIFAMTIDLALVKEKDASEDMRWIMSTLLPKEVSDGPSWYLWDVAGNPAYTRKTDEFLPYLQEQARDQGIGCLVILVKRQARRLQSMYEKYGFQWVDRVLPGKFHNQQLGFVLL